MSDDLVCTTMTVLVAACAGVVVLQLSILTTCLLCLYFSRAKHRATSHEDSLTTTSSSRSLPSHRTSTPLYHDNLGFR